MIYIYILRVSECCAGAVNFFSCELNEYSCLGGVSRRANNVLIRCWGNKTEIFVFG